MVGNNNYFITFCLFNLMIAGKITLSQQYSLVICKIKARKQNLLSGPYRQSDTRMNMTS